MGAACDGRYVAGCALGQWGAPLMVAMWDPNEEDQVRQDACPMGMQDLPREILGLLRLGRQKVDRLLKGGCNGEA